MDLKILYHHVYFYDPINPYPASGIVEIFGMKYAFCLNATPNIIKLEDGTFIKSDYIYDIFKLTDEIINEENRRLKIYEEMVGCGLYHNPQFYSKNHNKLKSLYNIIKENWEQHINYDELPLVMQVSHTEFKYWESPNIQEYLKDFVI